MKKFLRNGKVFNLIDRAAIKLEPKQVFLDWIISVVPSFHRWTLTSMDYSPGIYLTEPEDQNTEALFFLSRWREVLENELGNHLYIDKEKWPVLSEALLRKWYNFYYLESVIDLSGAEIETFED